MVIATELSTDGSDPRTRDRVVAAISERGPITAKALADALGLSAPGIRRHLDQLAASGLITSRTSASGKRGRGRPAREWVVSDQGHDYLPTGYDDLAADAVRFLAEAAGDDAVHAFATKRFAALERRYADEVAAAGDDPLERAAVLVAALRRDGYAASTRPVGGRDDIGIQLCQGHCPVQQVATEFPAFCDAETDAFARLLGVHVQRLATLAGGDHVCTTFIPTAAVTAAASDPQPGRPTR